jgi:hypothetical protein
MGGLPQYFLVSVQSADGQAVNHPVSFLPTSRSFGQSGVERKGEAGLMMLA